MRPHRLHALGRLAAVPLVLLSVAGCERPFSKKGPEPEAFRVAAEAVCAAKVQPGLAATSLPSPNDVEGIEAARVVVVTARAAVLEQLTLTAPSGQGSTWKALWERDVAVLDNRLAILRAQQAADGPSSVFAVKERESLVALAREPGAALGLTACMPPATTPAK